MSENCVPIIVVVAIIALCLIASVSIVGLLFYFSDKRLKASLSAKAEVNHVRASTDINIATEEQKN
ncbi:MAG TPA: hypothetical protein VIK77_04785 [Tissierellaceae bacterium]